ncbi:hypothetical protein ACF0H5_007423 [Mactra antiquata]
MVKQASMQQASNNKWCGCNHKWIGKIPISVKGTGTDTEKTEVEENITNSTPVDNEVCETLEENLVTESPIVHDSVQLEDHKVAVDTDIGINAIVDSSKTCSDGSLSDTKETDIDLVKCESELEFSSPKIVNEETQERDSSELEEEILESEKSTKILDPIIDVSCKTVTIDCSTVIENNCLEQKDTLQSKCDTGEDYNCQLGEHIESLKGKGTKSPIGFLKKFYLEETSIQKLGSIDVDDRVHEELEKLHEKPAGKTWNEELQEINNCLNDSGDDRIVDAESIDLDTDISIETDSVHLVPEIVGEASLPVVSKKLFVRQSEAVDLQSDSNTDIEKEIEAEDIEAEQTEKSELQPYCSDSEKGADNSFEIKSDINASFEESGENKNIDLQESEETVSTENSKTPETIVDNFTADIASVNNLSPTQNIKKTKGYLDDYNDSEAEVERAKELKAALFSCLKGKRGNFEVYDLEKDNEKSSEIYVKTPIPKSEYRPYEPVITTIDIDIDNSDYCKNTTKGTDELDSSAVDTTDKLKMPGTETESEIVERSISPSLMYASCKYRWEKSIITESRSVVFVTLNKKEIEPIKLNWNESCRCFYSDEVKVPVGVYVGNLVVDGQFYPVEDIAVKHYTFEVDLYLKDGKSDEKNVLYVLRM